MVAEAEYLSLLLAGWLQTDSLRSQITKNQKHYLATCVFTSYSLRNLYQKRNVLVCFFNCITQYKSIWEKSYLNEKNVLGLLNDFQGGKEQQY